MDGDQVSGSDTVLAPGTGGFRPERGRPRSFRAARRHSAVVQVLKVVIPVGAVLAVALVVLATYYNPLARIPGLTVGPISWSGSKIAMESPKLTGFRKDKHPYEVTATAAFQDIKTPNVIELKEMKARLVTDEAGTMAHLVSTVGVLDTGKEKLELSEAIRAWTDKGEEIRLKSASVDLKAGAVVSREPVSITTPTLKLDASGLEMTDNGKSVAFSGRVRLVITRGAGADGAGQALPATAGVKPPAKIIQAAGERP